jgi:hypothetical protein
MDDDGLVVFVEKLRADDGSRTARKDPDTGSEGGHESRIDFFDSLDRERA